MSLPVFDRLTFIPTTLDEVCRQLNQLSGSVRALFDRLQRNPRNDSVVLTSVALAGLANTVISHKLDRQPQGYLVWYANKVTKIDWVAWDAKTLTLYSTAGCAVSLEVW